MFEDVDQAYRLRNVALGVTAAIWALNIFDAALSFNEPWGTRSVETDGRTFGWIADPLNGQLAARVQF